jgi:3-deoxy-D-manno-octulosonate 8-phosphate phosphatase (KDO 8-P phosphatase)
MIKLILLDVDGVLTDGKKYYDREGNVRMKTFCDKDWTAIKRFKALGIPVVFLTGDSFNVTIAENRNIDVYVNRGSTHHTDKVEFLPEICKSYGVTPEEILYAGDDIFDVQISKAVGYSYCPGDACHELQKIVGRVINVKSGNNFVEALFSHLVFNKELPEFDFDEHLRKVYELDVKEKF